MTLRRRFQNAGIALLGMTLPFLIANVMGLLILTARHASRPVSTPNPKPALPWMLGPLAVLVHVDPWYAGTGIYLLWFGIQLLAAPVIVVFVGWPISSSQGSKRTMLLAVLALLVGLLFAGPWIAAVMRLMAKE